MFFKVFNGYRPPIPEGTPKGLEDLMEACWSHNPAERPSFKTIVRALQKLIIEVKVPKSPRVICSHNVFMLCGFTTILSGLAGRSLVADMTIVIVSLRLL